MAVIRGIDRDMLFGGAVGKELAPETRAVACFPSLNLRDSRWPGGEELHCCLRLLASGESKSTRQASEYAERPGESRCRDRRCGLADRGFVQTEEHRVVLASMLDVVGLIPL